MFGSRAATAAGLFLFAATAAPADEILRLDHPDDYELQAVGFELTRNATIRVDATGLRYPHWDEFTVYAWLLDTETRRPVWRMQRRGSDRVRGEPGLRRMEEELDLDAGRYELYLYSGRGWWNGVRIHDRGILSFWRDDDRDADWWDYEEQIDDCYVSLSSDDVSAGDLRKFEVSGGMEDALIRHAKVGDSAHFSDGFELTRGGNLHIYALIEQPSRDNPADYARIVDAETREEVWRTQRRNTRRAGGADKNRLFDDEVSLDAGRYVLEYGTDDSHSYEEFNANPPYDPVNWGVTVRPGEGFSASAFKAFDAPRPSDALVDFSRVGDSDYLEQGFRLGRNTKLWIVGIGEFGYDGEFADYGWITDAKTGEIAWEMTRRNTIPAGGADKNRMFDGLVELPAGDYVLHYVTDDSHSYDEWNSATPFMPDAWGVRLFAANAGDRGNFEKVDAQRLGDSENVIARIVRVGDHERRRERFELSGETRVHIYAMGEGLGGNMYDYAYIIDDESGDVVWEMRYRDTRPAGGARKNRLFDRSLTLPAGRYEVIYESDGSHSFHSWNDRRPRDPMNWGVTIRREG